MRRGCIGDSLKGSQALLSGTSYPLARLGNRRGVMGVPMDSAWQINLEAMLSGLTVAIFLILLAASVAVVSLMVLLRLTDLAFEKRFTAGPEQSTGLAAHDEPWHTGRPWLHLRRGDAIPDAQGYLTLNGQGLGRLRVLRSLSEALNHTTSLVERTNAATQRDRNLIVPRHESDFSAKGGMIEQPTPPDPVETIPPSRAA